MKQYVLIWFFVSLTVLSYGQQVSISEKYLSEGVRTYEKAEYAAALLQFEKAAEAAKVSGENSVLMMAYNNQGNVLSQMGKPELALKQYLNAISIAGKSGNLLQVAKTSKNIGALYSEQKDFMSAMQYYKEALNYAEKLHDKELIADCLNNMGVVYEQQLDYTKATDVYLKALHIYESVADEQRIAMTLNNLAIVYKCRKDYKKAIENYAASLKISEKHGDKFMVAANQNNLGNVFAEIGDYDKAIELCLRANKNAMAIEANEIVIESYSGIADAYEKKGMYKEAMAYAKLYGKAKDNFLNAERSSQMAEMQVRYETEKKESQIRMLKQRDEIQSLEISAQQLKIERRNQWIILFLLLLASLVFSVYYWRSRQIMKQRLERENIIRQTEEQERIRIAKDIHDDLGSGLSKINFLSEIILRETAQIPQIQSATVSVREIAARMIENMRDLIWALHPENVTLPGLMARMREYTSDYLEDYPISLRFSFAEKVPDKGITKESYRGLFMVVKEIMNNIARHSNASEVVFQIVLSDEMLMIDINDNGIGFDQQSLRSGNGLRNIESRINQLNGTIKTDSAVGRGTQITIKIPLQQMYREWQILL